MSSWVVTDEQNLRRVDGAHIGRTPHFGAAGRCCACRRGSTPPGSGQITFGGVEGATRSGTPEELRPRLVELVAALSLAADLGLGQTMDHGLRACLIATRLAARLELDQQTRDDVYWVSLLAMVGCTADSFELRQIWGDDLALRAGMFEAGPSELGDRALFPIPRGLGRGANPARPRGRGPAGDRHAGSGRIADDALPGHGETCRAPAVRFERSSAAPAHIRALGRKRRAARGRRRGDRTRRPPARRRELHRGRASVARC